MIKSILNEAANLIRDYPAEKARKESVREKMAIREAEFMKRFEEKPPERAAGKEQGDEH